MRVGASLCGQQSATKKASRARSRVGARSAPWLAMSAFLLIIVIASADSKAQTPPTSDAKEHYRRGTAAYNLGKYATAAQEYEAAYEITLDPALLFNVAQSYRLAGDAKKALLTYRSYLRAAPTGDRRALAEAKIRELEADKTGNNVAAATTAPMPTPADTAMGHEAAPLPAAVAPTAHSDEMSGRLMLEDKVPPSTDASSITHRWIFWAGIGAVVAAGIVTAIILSGSGSSTPNPQTTLGTMRF
jgi:tetratricopeptide (TPR) repeat protein